RETHWSGDGGVLPAADGTGFWRSGGNPVGGGRRDLLERRAGSSLFGADFRLFGIVGAAGRVPALSPEASDGLYGSLGRPVQHWLSADPGPDCVWSGRVDRGWPG